MFNDYFILTENVDSGYRIFREVMAKYLKKAFHAKSEEKEREAYSDGKAVEIF